MSDEPIPDRKSAMAKPEPVVPVDTDASPFAVAPIEGIPYAKGSAEDQAIRRILARSKVVEPSAEPHSELDDSPFDVRPPERAQQGGDSAERS